MRNRRYFPLAPLVAVPLALVASACSEPPAPPALKDLPQDNQQINVSDRTIYVNPDEFPNVVTWCDGSTRLYINTRQAGVNMIAVPNSPECPSR